jgi:hypothetical protein
MRPPAGCDHAALDTGPGGQSSFDIGARVVALAIWGRGVGRLDWLR